MERLALAPYRARSLRRDMTDVERWLWSNLRNRRLGGHKSVRQMPVGPFFADFGCREAKLIVELDGSQHANSRSDDARDAFLVSRVDGVPRLWNHEVATAIDDIRGTFPAAIEGRLEPCDRDRAAPPRNPSSGPSGHLFPGGEKGASPNDRDTA